jgi:hypothetical protein
LASAKLLQTVETFMRGLAAAIKALVYFLKIGNAGAVGNRAARRKMCVHIRPIRMHVECHALGPPPI